MAAKNRLGNTEDALGGKNGFFIKPRHISATVIFMTRSATCLRLFLCLALSAASAATPAASLKFHCDATGSTNAIYHLACLSGHIPCTKDVFERFWHGQLQWTPADQSELDAWTLELKKVENAAPPPNAAPYIGNYRSFFPGLDAQLHIIRAAIESRSLPDFQSRTRQWLTPDEAARLRRAIEHFRGRLKPWWQATGHNAVKARVRQVEKILRSDNMVSLAGQVSTFVEADAPAGEFNVHIISGPEPKSDAATGTFISNHCFIEATDAATADGVASVGIHELTHYLYETARAGKHVALMQQFVQAEAPHASAFYAFLNEALAVAVQRLIIERPHKSNEGKSDDGGYRDPFIPRLGQATAPVLQESLAKRSTLYQGFSKAYLREGNRELGGEVANPKFFLSSAAILPTDKGASAYDVFLKEFQPVSFIKSDQWRLFSHMNLVFLLSYDELGAFSTAFPDLASHANGRGFAYMGSRDGNASLCILAGADAAAIADVVRAFAKLRTVSSSGLLLSID